MQNKIYTYAADSKDLFIWKGIFLDKMKYPNSGFEKQHQRILMSNVTNEIIVTNTSKSKLMIWNLNNLKEKVKEIAVPTVPLEIAFKNEDEKVLYVGSKGVIYVYQTQKYEQIPTKIENSFAGDIYSLRCTPDYIITGGTSKKIIIQRCDEKGEEINEIVKHIDTISKIKIYEKYLITGDFGGVIYIHYLDTWLEYACLKHHKGRIRTLEVCNKGTTLVSVAHDNKIIFWSIYDKIPIKEKNINEEDDSKTKKICEGDNPALSKQQNDITDSVLLHKSMKQKPETEIDSCYLSRDERILIISTKDGKISVHALPSFHKILTLWYRRTENQRFAVSGDEQYLIVSNKSGVFRTLCPLNVENPAIAAKSVNIPEVKKFFNGGYKNENPGNP